MVFSGLLSQECKIYENMARENAIKEVTYAKRYLNSTDDGETGNFIPCRFDSTARRSRENVTMGAKQAEIKGIFFIEWDSINDPIENNYILEFNDSHYGYQFEICGVDPVYGFTGMLHHYECEVMDVNYAD